MEAKTLAEQADALGLPLESWVAMHPQERATRWRLAFPTEVKKRYVSLRPPDALAAEWNKLPPTTRMDRQRAWQEAQRQAGGA